MRNESWKAKGDNQVNDLYKLFQHVSGWVLYPAGVFFEDTDKNGKLLGTGVVVKYPNPKGLIKKLHKVADPTVLDGYEISIEEVEKEPDDYLSIQLTESSTRK